MVDSHISYLNGSYPKSNPKKEQTNTIMKYKNIWKEELPYIRDINFSIFKRVVVVVVGLFYLISIVLITFNLTFALFIMALYYICFFIIFHDNFFHFSNTIHYESANPFKDIQFWQFTYDDTIILMTNSRTQYTSGVKIFQVKVLPENVKANISRYISALSASYVPFSYQIVQQPLRSSLKTGSKDASPQRFQTLIYFSLFYDIHSKLTPAKLKTMVERLNNYAISLKNTFLSNFHHYQISLLAGKSLQSALRTFLIKKPLIPAEKSSSEGELNTSMEHEDETEVNSLKNMNLLPHLSFSMILKGIFIILMLLSIDFFLNLLQIILPYRILFSIMIGGFFLTQFVPQIFRLFPFINENKASLKNNQEILFLDLFIGVKFFTITEIKTTIFYQTEDGYIGGIKQMNLSYATPPIIALPYKFYQAVVQQGIEFAYTVQLLPISYDQFTDRYSSFLKEKLWNYMQKALNTPAKQNNWLAGRRGLWRTMLTISCSHTVVASVCSVEILEHIEKKLEHNINIMRNAFMANVSNCHFVLLSSHTLEMGILFEIFKTNRIRREGTHLYHIIFQGTTLPAFIWLSDMFKKGLETKIATEFNSPLHLENFITIGSTINTETLQREILAGFTKTQLDTLLVTNGNMEQQNLLVQRIVGELVKKQYPTIVFDFVGNYSRLIRQFEGTDLEDSFLYYKLGKTFNLDLVHSGIKHDPNNIDYLEFMFEAYANCFKKDERTIEIFKNSLMRNLDKGTNVSGSTIALGISSEPDWLHNQEPGALSVMNFFKDFSHESNNFLHLNTGISSSYSLIKEFLTNKRTIIIDLSLPNGLEKKLFLMFIILAKCIHYINNGESFIPKSLVIPHIELAFDAFFIEKNMRYGRIGKFFDPLRKYGFGLIATTSQVRYLHSNLFTYFENFVSFKAVDSRDIKTLKNIMSLDNVHGTGIFSKTRNEPYQVQYLMSMRFDEALIKRDDLYQPFPIEADWKDVLSNSPLTWDEIVKYMKKQGYDLEYAVKKLIAETKKTIFEKDFGEYSYLIEPTISFLSDLRTMDQIGNLYAETIKKELKIRLDTKISEFTQNKKRKKNIRDILFSILLKHGYLEEHHPTQASGSESIRTSYFVGPQFDKALEDFIKVKKQIPPEIEVLQQESNATIDSIIGVPKPANKLDIKETPISTPRRIIESVLDQRKLKEVIARAIGDTLFFDLFEIFRAISHKDYRTGLEIVKQYLDHFIFQVYNSYYKVDYIITKEDLDQFIVDMTHTKDFPYSYKQFNGFVELCRGISFHEDNLEQTIKNAYKQLEALHNAIKDYIYSN